MRPSIEIKNIDDERITFTLFGSERDNGFVRLDDLSRCITRLQECLRETERCVTGKRATQIYVIEKMLVGIPADVTFLAKKPRHGPDFRGSVAALFRQTIAQLAQGDRGIDSRLDYAAIRAYQRCGDITRKGSDGRQRRRLVIAGTEISRRYLFTSDNAAEIAESSFGSVTGVLERIDVHGSNQFVLFPRPEGSPHVRCFFKEALLLEVAASIKRTVTVYGKLHFAANRVLPVSADVQDMDMHESADDLPSLSALAGCLSQLNEDSKNIIRKIRNEWAK